MMMYKIREIERYLFGKLFILLAEISESNNNNVKNCRISDDAGEHVRHVSRK